jgi:REP element-mobilizing transposase RayT
LAPSFRSQRAHAAIVRKIRHLSRRGVRVIHYCIQHDHLHLMVEADDRTKLARSMQLLFSRVAFDVNRIAARSGSLFRDRHHRHELKTPSEVRRALVYIFFNTRKHDPEILGMEEMVNWIDECTSAIWFNDWSPSQRPPDDEVERKRKRAGTSPLTNPRTWLARIGWQRAGGPLRFNETPKIHITTHL